MSDSAHAATPEPGAAAAKLAGFLAICSPCVLGAFGLLWGGWWALHAPLLIFVLVPLADLVLGVEPAAAGSTVPTRTVPPRSSSSLLATWLPRVAALMQVGLVLLGAQLVARTPTPAAFVIAVVIVGTSGGVMGIVSAHELVHRQRRVDLWFAEIVLATVGHMHWAIEHLGGHHCTIGLPGDPGTARLGETLYAYWWRYLISSYTTALRLDRDRRRKYGLRRSSPASRMFWYSLIPPALGVLLGLLHGWLVVAYFVAQALLAFTLLAAVNYIEHYGLERHRDATGRPEPIGTEHSWDSDCLVSNRLLLNLQLHADHHIHPARGFDRLRSGDGPQLPTGYMGMFWLALVPSLWRRVMDPPALAWRCRQQQAVTAQEAI